MEPSIEVAYVNEVFVFDQFRGANFAIKKNSSRQSDKKEFDQK